MQVITIVDYENKSITYKCPICGDEHLEEIGPEALCTVCQRIYNVPDLQIAE